MIQTAAGNQTAMSAQKGGKKGIQDLIKVMEPEIKKALPSVLTPERFTRMVLSALSTNPKLAGCTPASFLGAMMTAAQLGVEPNTPLGQAYLIPYSNHGTDEVQFQLGYKGLIDLAYRSGQVSTIQAHVVRENDHFEYALGLDPKLEHVPAASNRGEATHYYAVVRMKDGGFCFAVMSKEEVEAHARKYSKAYSSGYSPWKTNFDEMAKKTVLKRALKYAPMKSEFVRGVTQDMSVKTEISDDMYSVTDTSDLVEVSDEEMPAADPETGEVING
jgi:recombination protein RecT